jgi:hypothetical protein
MQSRIIQLLSQIPIAASIALAVLGFRLYLIYQHGLQFPINDQWYSEYNNLYKPYLEGSLGLSDFFASNNEHVVAIQKGIHLALLIVAGEWNPMAQMFLNAILFSIILFIAALLAGLYLAPVPSVVFQGAILVCGLMPGPAENFLFGFQTGWYVYYFLSGLMLYCLSKSEKFGFWWLSAWFLAILSCLCLASGIGNMCLCVAAPTLRDWSKHTPLKHVLLRSTPYLALCLPVILLFLKIALEGRPPLPASNQSLVLSLLEIFSYPAGFLPITFLPTAVGLGFVIFRKPFLDIGFPILFAFWALAHTAILCVGRGGFSGRHTELLIFGTLANLLMLLSMLPFIAKWHPVWLRRIPAFWLAAIFGGLAFQAIQSQDAPKDFADFMRPRYELLKESILLKDSGVLTARSWETGLPAGLFSTRPELLNEPIYQKISPSSFPFGLSLFPPARENLSVESLQMFPTPFPFLLWDSIRGAELRTENFRAEGVLQPFAKIVIAGRWDDPDTGIYANGHKQGLKLAFSQSEGWRAVFLPVKDGAVQFTAKVFGPRDWLLIQQPIPVSKLQVAMEFIGRQSSRIWAFFMGLSLFLIFLKFFLALPFSVRPNPPI